MAIKRSTKGRMAYLWKATIDFDNTYAKKGTHEWFETKYDAEDWLKGIKVQYGKKKLKRSDISGFTLKSKKGSIEIVTINGKPVTLALSDSFGNTRKRWGK